MQVIKAAFAWADCRNECSLAFRLESCRKNEVIFLEVDMNLVNALKKVTDDFS